MFPTRKLATMNTEITDSQRLIRGLGLIAAVSVIIGNVIGTGVFLKARVMTCNVGSPTWVIVAWIAAGLLSLAGALTYAELTAMKPKAGGEYVFLRDAFGRVWSFLFGWMQIFIAKPGSQAAAGMAFAIGMNDFLDKQLERTIVSIPLGNGIEITSLQVVALMVIVIFTTLNCATVTISGQIATALTFVKIILIFFVGVGAFIWVSGHFANFSLFNSGGTCEGVADAVKVGAPNYSFVGGFGAAMLAALWGYDGWNNLTFVAGEVRNPNRNIPLAIIGSTVLVIVLYVFVHIGYFYVLDPTTIASVSKSSSVAKTVVGMFFGGDAASIATGAAVAFFAVGLMLSSLGTLHTSILAGSRIPYAMAKDGLMFNIFGQLSVNHVPVPAVLMQGVWACLLAMTGSFDLLTDYVIFGSWIFYALVTVSIFVFRKRYPDAERPYKAFGYPVVPVLFLLVAAWLIYITFSNDLGQARESFRFLGEGQPVQALQAIGKTSSFAGSLLILLGLPVYYYFIKRTTVAMPDEGDQQ
jgi:basic amino acid/polyamine antiporter, APA family